MARTSAVDAVKAETDRDAANVLPIIREAQKTGQGHDDRCVKKQSHRR
jgi:hypothetical protein